MPKIEHHIIVLALAACITAGCKRQDVGWGPERISLPVPANFPPVPASGDNPLTREGVELGRRLFYDTRLSGNNRLSCASCHDPAKAFSDGRSLTNIGVSGATLHRHSPALINIAWADKGLFWDGGSANLESQAFAPLTSADEMAQNLYELEQELHADPYYVRQFQLAFGDTIKSAYVARALAQFQRTMISAGSKYDRYINGQTGILTSLEREGMRLVEQKCSPCHNAPLFTDNDFHNNGIDADFSSDAFENIFKGRSRITNNPADLGKFKTPTLRNVMQTAPYMHDGRFNDIGQVLDHYSGGVQPSPTLDSSLLQADGRPGLLLSEKEKAAITAFLHTLTDIGFITNSQLNNPFIDL